MERKVVHIKRGLVEYKGEFYTADELAEKLEVTGEFEVVLHDSDDTWFGKYMDTLEDKQ